MRKPRQFRPTLTDSGLEERVVMSVSASQLATAAVYPTPVKTPVATSEQVNATLNQIRSALLSFQTTATNAILYAEAQIAAKHVTQAQAISLLNGYLDNKTSAFAFAVRSASGNLPYGMGFNGFILSPTSPVSALPSGADSLYADLTFPSNGSNGPIATARNNLFTPIAAGDFAGALKAVNSTAIRTTFAQVKAVVNQYIIHGVAAHDFTYHK